MGAIRGTERRLRTRTQTKSSAPETEFTNSTEAVGDSFAEENLQGGPKMRAWWPFPGPAWESGICWNGGTRTPGGPWQLSPQEPMMVQRQPAPKSWSRKALVQRPGRRGWAGAVVSGGWLGGHSLAGFRPPKAKSKQRTGGDGKEKAPHCPPPTPTITLTPHWGKPLQ